LFVAYPTHDETLACSLLEAGYSDAYCVPLRSIKLFVLSDCHRIKAISIFTYPSWWDHCLLTEYI
jgi:hypothetical protein